MTTARKTREISVLHAKAEDLIEAVAELGIIEHACKAVGLDRKAVWRMEKSDPTLGARLMEARRIGRERRLEYLEGLAYEMAPTNPTMVMFLLKKLDPSYRESYSVSTSSTPTNYVIDLSLPSGDDTPHDADQGTNQILG